MSRRIKTIKQYKNLISIDDIIEILNRMLTFFFSACSSPTRIRVLRRPPKNRTEILRTLFRRTQIIVNIIVIDAIPFLKLSLAVSSQLKQFFFPVLAKRCWCLMWQICLSNESKTLARDNIYNYLQLFMVTYVPC